MKGIAWTARNPSTGMYVNYLIYGCILLFECTESDGRVFDSWHKECSTPDQTRDWAKVEAYYDELKGFTELTKGPRGLDFQDRYDDIDDLRKDFRFICVGYRNYVKSLAPDGAIFFDHIKGKSYISQGGVWQQMV